MPGSTTMPPPALLMCSPSRAQHSSNAGRSSGSSQTVTIIRSSISEPAPRFLLACATQVDGQSIDVIEAAIERSDRQPFVAPVREHFARLGKQSGARERRDACRAIDLAVGATGFQVRNNGHT